MLVMMMIIIMIIKYIFKTPIDDLNSHRMHINLKTIFYTHAKHSPADTVYTKHYLK